MDVRQAVDLAKTHVADLFAKEGLVNLGLEEVEYVDGRDLWRITVGFSRAWDLQGSVASLFAPATRTYKAVTIANEGKVISVKNRETADAA
jgi:hypothetical protein